MSKIVPTIGRMAYYFPSKLEQEIAKVPFLPSVIHGAGPLSCNVAHVFSETMVNLCVIDSNGVGHARQSVPFIPDSDTPVPTDGSAYATWMPFQFGQAAPVEPVQTPAPSVDPAPAPAPVADTTTQATDSAVGTATTDPAQPAA